MTLFVVVVLIVSPSSLAFVAVVLTGNAQHRDRVNFIFNDTKFFYVCAKKAFLISFLSFLSSHRRREIHLTGKKTKKKGRRPTGLLLLHKKKFIH